MIHEAMKKILMLLTALAAWCGSAKADGDGLVVQDISVPQGGMAILEIALENPTTEFAAFQFNIQLAEGITVSTNDKGKFVFERGDRLDEDFSLSMSQPTQGTNTYRVLGYYTETQPIAGTTGTIIRVTIQADASLAVNSSHTCQLTAINLTEPDETKHTPDPISFEVTIDEPDDGRVILNETSTTAPVAANGVNVRVIRTIKANEWSTICLPFSMTEEQVEAAFGGEIEEDVFLADFQGYDVEEEGDEIVGIDIDFVAVTSIEANHPYLIKVSGAVSEFTVDGVNIEPEDVPCVALGTTTGKGKNAVYHPMDFVGTYVADFDFYHAAESRALFINSNKFYYATANTKLMKAFRAYFDFDDVLPEVEFAASKIRLVIDDGAATTIDEISAPHILEGAVYNVNSQLVGTDVDMNTLPKGIYLVDGKKVAIY